MINHSFLRHLLLLVVVLLGAGCGASTPEDAPRRPAVQASAATHRTTTPAAAQHGDTAAASATGPAVQQADTVAVAMKADSVALESAPLVEINDSFRLPMAAPVSFEVMAIAMRDTVRLTSTAASDAAGFACASPTVIAGTESGGLRTLPVFRFAHSGAADSPFAMHWVLFLPEGAGVLEGRKLSRESRPAGGDAYEVTLRGMLEFNLILRGATQPMRLITRKEPEFKGYSKTWPPYGAVLKLTNGPIGFFHKDNRPNQRAAILVVHETRFSIGKRPTKYMGQPPKIVKAEILDGAGHPWKSGTVTGVRVEWKGTPPAPVELAGYNVYRATAEGGGWQRIAELPASTTSYIDKEYDGRAGMRYAVVYRTRYAPDFDYDGVVGPHVTVASVR